MLIAGSPYKIRVNFLSPNGTFGWAAYQFDTEAGPSEGTCYGVPLDRKDVGALFNISCNGWLDEKIPPSYEFYHELKEGELNMLSYEVWPYSVVIIPPSDDDVALFMVTIANVVGTANTTRFSVKVSII